MIKQREVENPENLILTGLIVSTEAINSIRAIYQPTFFQTRWTRVTAEWCIEYYEKYQKAPGRHIQDIFESKELDENTNDLLRSFLEGISGEYERCSEFNAEYIVDLTERYFQNIQLEALSKKIRDDVRAGNTLQALTAVRSFENVSRKVVQGTSLFDNNDNLFSEDDSNNLFMLPGAIGKLFGMLKRKQLIAFMAPAKRGKSWWIEELVKIGMLKGYNTVIFSLEMEEREIKERITMGLTGRPLPGRPTEILIPVFDCVKNQQDTCTMDERSCTVGLLDDGEKPSFEQSPAGYTACNHCEGTRDFWKGTWFRRVVRKNITGYVAARKLKAVKQMSRGDLRVVYFPPDSTTVEDLEGQLDHWKREGFIPDIIGIDYADLLGVNKNIEYRHKLDHIWKHIKRLSQDRSCLVVTASQASKDTYDKKIKKNIS